jgi:hypothetical protein
VTLATLVDRFIAHHAALFPVDATFMGLPGANHLLPPAHPDVPAEELAALDGFRRALDSIEIADTPGERMDARILRAAIAHARLAIEHRPRLRQPCWYSSEIAFGLISLLLPAAPADAAEALALRIEAIPAFLAAGMRHLHDQPTPPDWSERARRECAAIERLLLQGLPMHPLWREELAPACARAAAALDAFEAPLGLLPVGNPACGRDHLAILMRDVQGLAWSPEEALALATEAHAERERDLVARAAAIDTKRDWRTLLADLAADTRPPDRLPGAYGHWHDRAMADATALVTPAEDYALTFAPLPDWARPIAGDIRFLSYRSPPALDARSGSIHWTATAPQSMVEIKQDHATHNGSLGRHTQNARARQAASRLARLAGTDCASGIAFLSAGTMVGGWACHASAIMAEIDGFYSPAEELALIQADRRNAARVIADIKLHTGAWSLEEMRDFCGRANCFPAPRISSETTRNALLPATGLMYFLGTEQIKALRRQVDLPARSFHDALLAHGHVAVAWAAAEILRAR